MVTRTDYPPNGGLPLHLRLANVVAGGWQRLGWADEFSSRQLIDRVTHGQPHCDFGQPDVREPLTELLESYVRDARFTPLGRYTTEHVLEEMLRKRLALEQWRQRAPDLADREIEGPIFVVGMPRSGTTLLHNLLAQAPNSQTLRTWQLTSGAKQWHAHHTPPVTKSTWQSRQIVRYLNWAVPGLTQIHPLSADGHDECTMLLMHSLVSLTFLILGPADSYREWYWRRGLPGLLDVYKLHRRQLNFLARHESPRSWVLKSPTHLAGLHALLTVYPTAQVVLTERDPEEAIPSACSLFAMVRRLLCHEVHHERLGSEIGGLLGRTIIESAGAREQFSERIFTVAYRDLVRNPRETVQRLYAQMGRAVVAPMDAGMQRWLTNNPQHKHGVHRYSATEFGFDAAAWRRDFGAAYEALFRPSAVTRISA